MQNTVIYYRVKLVDIDGKFDYSNIVHLGRTKATSEIAAYPSPFNNYLNITYQCNESSNVTIEVRDVCGRLCLLQNETIEQTQATIQLADIDKLKSGLYIISVLNNDTNEKDLFKVVKE